MAIARALVLEPKLILCDEPVSSLDVLVQAQVLNLLEKLRSELGLSYLFIAHDLALVKQVSDRVAVMYLGKLCEIGPVQDIYRRPLHPYTLALLTSIPSAGPSAGKREARTVIRGELPSPLNPPSGCRFRTRCPRAQERCAAEARSCAPSAATGTSWPAISRFPAARRRRRAPGLRASPRPSDVEAERAELLAAVLGDLVGAPRRHPDPVDPEVVDQPVQRRPRSGPRSRR